MRVLHVIGSLDQNSGGPLRTTLDLSSRAAIFGLESEIVGFGPMKITDNPLGTVTVHSLPVLGRAAYCYSPELPAWCSRNLSRYNAAVIHGMWTHASWTVSHRCIEAGVPYAYFPHGMLDHWPVKRQGRLKFAKKALYWLWREKKVCSRAAAVFFTTRREMESAGKTFALPRVPQVVVPYGAADPAGPHAAEPDPALVQPPGRKVALFLGRVHPIKKVDFLLRAWSKASPGPDWRLVVAGPVAPDYLRYLESVTAECGLQGSVEFVGPVSGGTKAYLLKRAEWFLLPSEHENFGVAVLEAVHSGCATAISDQVYLSEFFPAGSEVLPLKLDTWVQFIRERMPDEKRRGEIVRRTTETLLPVFDMNTVARRWAETLQATFAS